MHAKVDAEPVTQAQPEYDPDELEEWFDANPTKIPQVATRAFYANNDALMEAAIDAWEELDKPAARAFDRQVTCCAPARRPPARPPPSRLSTARSPPRRARFARRGSRPPSPSPRSTPTFVELAPKMREIAPQYPAIVEVLRSGHPQAQLDVLEFLYEEARGQSAETLAQAAVRSPTSRPLEQSRRSGRRPSPPPRPSRPQGPSRVAERIAKQWDKQTAPFAGSEDGWNV
jgi:hypothetical protein